MLRSNLSTRPFYNERRVHLAAALVALAVVAFTAWNVTRLVTLSSRRADLRTQIAADEQVAADLRRRAAALEGSVDTAALTEVAASAREANAVIDRRTFSWTTFFNRLEDTLPPGVMIAGPRMEKRRPSLWHQLPSMASAIAGPASRLSASVAATIFNRLAMRMLRLRAPQVPRTILSTSSLPRHTPLPAP